MIRFKDFFSTLIKTLRPKYYREFSQKTLVQASRFFLSIVFVSFVLLFVLLLPRLFAVNSYVNTGALDITELVIEADLETSKPVMFPPIRPLVTLDTTDNKTMETEILLITEDTAFYNIFGNEGEYELEGFDFAQNRESSLQVLTILFLLMVPGIILFYYVAYVIKYLLIIIPFSGLAYLFSKTQKSVLTFKQAIIISLYTASGMVLIEILTIPFFLKDYLVTLSPFFGINYSMVALTLYLILSVTAMRIIGSTKLRY